MKRSGAGSKFQDMAELGPGEAAEGELISPVSAENRRSRTGGQLAGRLGRLSLPMQVVTLAVWPLLENLMSVLVGTIDLMLAGRLRPESMAVAAVDALGAAGYFHWFMGLLMASIGIGATAIIARAIGGRHRRVANAAVGQSLLLAVVMGCGVLVLLWTLAPTVARLLLEPEAQPLFVRYLRVLSLGSPAMGVLFVGNACLRGAGDTRTPFFVMVAVNIANALASVTFVYGPAPIGGHGVTGIAWGTTLAWCVGAAAVILTLASGWGNLRLRAVRLIPRREMLLRVTRVGLPNLFESSGQWLGNMLVLGMVGLLGWPGAVGSHFIAIRIESISFLPGYALGTAAATLAGQYLGAGSPQRARQAIGLCWAIGAGLMTLVGIAFIVVPEVFVRVISDAETHMETVPTLLRICGPVQIFFGTYLVLSQGLRGSGDTFWAMLLTYSSTFLVRLPLAFAIGYGLGWGLTGLWLGLCGELVVRGSIFAARFLHGGWTRVRV